MEIWEVEEGESSIEGLLEDGTPDPAYAAALGLVQAPLQRRAAAAAIDLGAYLALQLPWAVVTLPLLLKAATGRISAYGLVNHPHFKVAAIVGGLCALLTIGYCIAQLASHGSRGMTLGKGLLGLRSVNVRTLEKPGFGRVLLRALLIWAAGIVPFGSAVVLASPLFDKSGRSRGWHDKVGDTWYIDVRAGLNPYDEKRMRIARKTVAATPPAERAALPSLTGAPHRSEGAAFQPGSRLSAGVIGRSEPVLPATPATPSVPGGSLATPSGGPSSAPAAAGATPPTAAAPAPATPAVRPMPPAATPSAPAPAPSPAPSSTPAAAPAAAVPPPPPAPAPSPEVVEAPPTPAAPAAPTPTPASERTAALLDEAFVLVLDTGQEIAVDGPVVLGRNPKSPADVGARPVAISDEQLSRTHLVVRPIGSEIELTDCGSSNGTTVTHQGVERRVPAGQPTLAGPGDTIQIGQRTATIRRA
jgi:uncharacterized RDD family membrane protein YckC